ncbi:Otolin-1, partial [Ophiophagus hannah]
MSSHFRFSFGLPHAHNRRHTDTYAHALPPDNWLLLYLHSCQGVVWEEEEEEEEKRGEGGGNGNGNERQGGRDERRKGMGMRGRKGGRDEMGMRGRKAGRKEGRKEMGMRGRKGGMRKG